MRRGALRGSRKGITRLLGSYLWAENRRLKVGPRRFSRDAWHVLGKRRFSRRRPCGGSFHGQGMNCAFEDCAVFNELLTCTEDLAKACILHSKPRRSRTRRPSPTWR